MMASDSELRVLLEGVARKDKAAFAALYRALEKPLYRFIVSKMNDPHQSGDILHDVFLEIWKSAGRFEGRSAVKSWVFGIAYRKVMDVFRKTARVDLREEMPDEIDDGPDGEACVLAAQNAAHVRFCLDTLKPQQRSAIELAFFEDMSYREIADVTDVPEGTVKTRVFHAKQLLLRCLEGRLGTGEKR